VGLAQIERGLECTLDAVDLVEAEAEAKAEAGYGIVGDGRIGTLVSLDCGHGG